MTYTYIAPHTTVAEIRKAFAAFEAAGLDPDQTTLGLPFDQFAAQLPDRSTVVVHSVAFFSSLNELLTALGALSERQIALRSLQEPWLAGETGSTAEFLMRLRELSLLLHQNRTRQGLQKARSAGKRLGRPIKTRRT